MSQSQCKGEEGRAKGIDPLEVCTAGMEWDLSSRLGQESFEHRRRVGMRLCIITAESGGRPAAAAVRGPGSQLGG